MPGANANIRGLGGFVWSIAEILRGDFKQSEYGKVILPFIVLRRLDCLLDATKQDVLEAAKGLSEAVDDPTRDMILFAAAGENIKVYNLSAFTFESLKAQDPGQLHDNLIDYITKFSGNVRDIFLDKFLFTEQLKRLNEGGILWQVFDRFTQIDLYHRAECQTHVGDSQAVRSLTQCGEPMRFAMAAPIDLRNDFDSVSLRRLAKRTRDATQSRRLLALAEVYDGGSRTDASRIGGVGLQIIRDWVLRFNARGPDGLVDGKSPGAPSKLNADHRRALAEVVEAGPVPAVDGVVRWRRKDLARWLLETFAISLDETTVGRELKALGFAKISARPRHYAQNELAVEAFKKNFPAELAKIRARLPKGVEIELWWQDEARIGQKNKLTRRWARRGTRPRAPRDQRTEWAYIFGAICPAKGKGAGLVMPWCDTDAMAAHLIEISAAVDPGAHAVLIVDQAGWHLTPKLAIPDNITVLALPPRSPELNPVENVWQFMRDNWLSNRIFKSYEDIVALCCQAWNNLIDQPWKIMSLGMRKWAHGF